MMKKRGFIGPLGDDIPSIFPIVAGMLLFISTILYVNAQVDTRNLDLRQKEATQKLAYLATQKASFQIGEFESLCKNALQPFAENNGLKFAIVIKRFCNQGCLTCTKGIDLQNSNAFNEDEMITNSNDFNKNYVCTNEKPEVAQEYAAARASKAAAPKNTITLIYPFTVPCPDYDSSNNGLATLNVLVWK